MNGLEVTVGIGGAAGDGNAATGDTLAKVCARLGYTSSSTIVTNQSSVAAMCGSGCASPMKKSNAMAII